MKCVAMVVACGLTGSAFGQSFTGVGDLAGGRFVSEALGVSGDGTKVVGYSEIATNQSRAFIWSAGTITGLANVGSYRPSVAQAISNNGVVVGEAAGPNGTEAFKKNLVQGNFRALGGTVVGGSSGSSAFAISSDGARVVGSHELPGSIIEACRWDGPALTGLGYISNNGKTSIANGISGDGTIIVGESDGGSGTVAFVSVDGGALTALPTLGGPYTSARAISRDGNVIVGVGALVVSGNHAFRYVRATQTMTDIGDFAGGVDYSEALAVNADGSVIVGRSNGTNGLVATIWDVANGLRDLKATLVAAGVTNLTGWTLKQANGISDDGTVICGSGTDPAGNAEGWVAVLPRAHGCPADFNGDGAVDFFDYDDFVTCFEGGACPPGKTADFNNDGAVDFFDYDDYVAAFETACI